MGQGVPTLDGVLVGSCEPRCGLARAGPVVPPADGPGCWRPLQTGSGRRCSSPIRVSEARGCVVVRPWPQHVRWQPLVSLMKFVMIRCRSPGASSCYAGPSKDSVGSDKISMPASFKTLMVIQALHSPWCCRVAFGDHSEREGDFQGLPSFFPSSLALL